MNMKKIIGIGLIALPLVVMIAGIAWMVGPRDFVIGFLGMVVVYGTIGLGIKLVTDE